MSKNTYTKRNISEKVADRINLDKKLAHEMVSEVFTVMREMLSGDSKNIRIEIRNFGTFTIKPTKAKPRARNPRTNEEIYVPPHRKSHFKPGRLLKEELRKTIQ